MATNYENPNCNCFYQQKIKLSYPGLLQLYFFLLFSTFFLSKSPISKKDITIDRDVLLFFYFSAGF